MGVYHETIDFGAGPLGSLYASLLHRAGNDVTVLTRNAYYKFLKDNGVVLFNEFSQERTVEKVNVVSSLHEKNDYDLVIVIMRKNSLKNVFPLLSKNRKVNNFLFMGNNTLGFEQYLKFLPEEKVLFGYPGSGGSRINHIVHYIDSEKPGGKRRPVIPGEPYGPAEFMMAVMTMDVVGESYGKHQLGCFFKQYSNISQKIL